MDAMSAIKRMAELSNTPLMHIGRKMGVSDNYVNKTITRGSKPRIDTVARMASVCGYGLYLIPEKEAPQDAIQITND